MAKPPNAVSRRSRALAGKGQLAPAPFSPQTVIMELFEDNGGNAPALSVSDISGAIKRVIEGEFSRVRVRGEVGRVSRPSSGHLYFDLKDDRAVLAAVTWKGQATKLSHHPEEGMEVIVTGRLTTFPGQSKYQLIVDEIEPAGLGALMAMLDKLRRQLAAEGLFDPARKKPIPALPRVIGVVTSPSGAVIRDILHRLRDRFPTRVLIWPVAVQGKDCAPQVANAIHGFNALPVDGTIPRPDVIIVARGGGSLEDLWGFNEEVVARAAASSRIPLISAVGHETDTTLIDHAADLRAPTPTAAAEMAVPVRAELVARLAEAQARMIRAARARVERPRQRLADLARALGRPQSLAENARQRFDLTAPRLEAALRGFVRDRRAAMERLHTPVYALRGATRKAREDLTRLDQRLRDAPSRRLLRLGGTLPSLSQRLGAARARMLTDARRGNIKARADLNRLDARLVAVRAQMTERRRDRLENLDRLRLTLGYTETLKRGFAVVHDADGLVTTATRARIAPRLEIEFADGRVPVRPEDAPDTPKRRKSGGDPPPDQGAEQASLF